MEEQEQKKSNSGGLIMAGCMFVGAGIGMMFGSFYIGGTIGLGIGLIVMGGMTLMK